MEMRIRNVHHTTRENLKKFAAANDMSIGQVLNAQYGSLEPPNLDKKGIWTIKGISHDIKKQIKSKALNRRMTVGDYLAALMLDQESCDEKLNRLKNEVREALDNFS
jgi:predicted nucleotidyltransferase